MAVRKLAGPFTVQAIPGLGRSRDPVALTFAAILTWWPGVGLMVDGGFVTYVVTLDGWAGRVADETASYTTAATATWGWWPAQNKMVWFSGAIPYGINKEFVTESIGFSRQLTHPNDQLPADYAGMVNQGWSYAKLEDRRVFVHGVTISSQVKGSLTDTLEVTLPAPFGSVRMYPGRHRGEVFLSDMGAGPVGCFWDTRTKTIVSPLYYFPEVCSGIVYAPEYGVFVSVASDEGVFKLNVWSLEVEATELTPVEVLSGEIKAGQVVTYRTRVLGDDDDPAEGELVNWTLDGVGTILDVQTPSDSDGYATTRVEYGLEENGPSTVIASIVC